MKRLKSKEQEKDCRIAGKFNNSTLTINRAVIRNVLPGEVMHLHTKATEYYIILRGKAEMQVNDATIEVEDGDVVVVEPGEKHVVSKIVEEMDYMIIRDSVEDDKIII